MSGRSHLRRLSGAAGFRGLRDFVTTKGLKIDLQRAWGLGFFGLGFGV